MKTLCISLLAIVSYPGDINGQHIATHEKLVKLRADRDSMALVNPISESEIDPIDNVRRILTVDAHGPDWWISYRSVGKTIFLNLVMDDSDIDVISGDERLIFLLKNGTKVTIKSKGIQSSTDAFEYYISPAQVRLLSNNKVTLFRFYRRDSYTDFKLDDDSSEKINLLSNGFLKEYLKFF